MTSAKCGTPSGYNRHKRVGENACDDCRAAWAAWTREYRRNPDVAKAHRELQRAHARAAHRLTVKYRDEYRTYVAEEMRLMREGS